MQQPSFDTCTIIFLISAVQGLFLSLLLFMQRGGNKQANHILALIMFLFSVSMIYYVLFWTGYNQVYRFTDGWVAPLPFLYGPLTYVYLWRLNEKRTPKRYYWHYIPFALHAVFMLPLLARNIFGVIPFLRDNYFIPFGYVIDNLNNFFYELQCFSMLVYAVIIYLYVRKEKQKLNAYALEEEKIKYNWLKTVVRLYFLFALAGISYYVLVWAGWLKIEYDYAISAAMSVFIYTVGYMGFRQPEIFHDPIIKIGEETESRYRETKVIPAMSFEKQKKYLRSTLKEEDAKVYLEKLILLMETEKPFLNNSIKIQQLAEKLELSSHHLSQILNELLHENFSEFINTYRVNEAKRLLADPHYDAKILSIAFDAGFSNKATFNAVFKKATGMAPSEYRKQALHKAIA
ncbi:MAG: helix-turn-helix domain-containing protein [Chitinophagales bacterium]